jgi:serine/threonine protein kinase
LKPENIIITRNGENVKLTDFGLADTDSHAVLKQPAGTPRYMSPEQMQTSVTDVRNDIYSLGIIFQQMKLGHSYHKIINRCLLHIDQRYPNVQALQEAVVRHKKRVRWGMILAVVRKSSKIPKKSTFFLYFRVVSKKRHIFVAEIIK